MNRRTLLKYLLSTPLALTVDVEKLLWIPRESVFIPSQRQIEFYGGGRGGGKSILWGIPYHQCNGSTDKWLEFERKK